MPDNQPAKPKRWRRAALAGAIALAAPVAAVAATEAPASAASWCSTTKWVNAIDLGSYLLWVPKVQTRQDCFVSDNRGTHLDYRNYSWHNVSLATALWYDVGDRWVGAPFG